MDVLYSWTARRSGANMTLIHSCGKIAGIREIAPNGNGQLIATKGEQQYMLATPPFLSPDQVSIGASDLFFNFEDAVAAFRLEEDEDRDAAMLRAAEDFRTMLSGAGIAPPAASALVADFVGRV